MTIADFFSDKTFKSKKELYHALKDNEDLIIDQKKSKVYKSIDKGQGIVNIPIEPKTSANKSQFSEGFIYPVINSTGWLDSHQDVHIRGCYTKSVKEQQGNVYFIDSHLKGVQNIITRKKDIEMFVDDVDWRLLGKSIEGSTQALVFKIAEDKVKPEYLSLIKEDRELQNSFAMRYVKIKMAIDSTDKEFQENRDVFYSHIDSIANKEQAQKDGFFFAVEELAIMGEGSICPIIGGSNSATRNIIAEPSIDTQENKEPPQTSTQKEKFNLNYFI